MNKMERNDLRIEKIINERKNLLDLVKANIIKDQNEYLRDDIVNIVTVLVKDEEHVKSYKAVIKAQALIEDLTKQIVEAKTVEEIAKIRNKLNYYINKIKKEAISRGISEEDCNKYYEHASILRKDIAKYIRFLKKEQRIEELAKRHGMGINSVKRFQNLIKDIVPMKKDLITTMLSKETIEELNLLPFFPNQEKQKKKSLIINEKKEV